MAAELDRFEGSFSDWRYCLAPMSIEVRDDGLSSGGETAGQWFEVTPISEADFYSTLAELQARIPKKLPTFVQELVDSRGRR